MEVCKVKKEEIKRNAEILLWKTEALIKQCDSWLSAEEGNENMMKEYMKRKKNKIFQVPSLKFQSKMYNFALTFAVEYQISISLIIN